MDGEHKDMQLQLCVLLSRFTQVDMAGLKGTDEEHALGSYRQSHPMDEGLGTQGTQHLLVWW